MADKYQGWANYPTWAVNLWLANDHDTYEYIREMVAECQADASDDDGGVEWDAANYELARRLEDFVAEMADDSSWLESAGPLTDLLTWALGQVAWLEIAESWTADDRLES